MAKSHISASYALPQVCFLIPVPGFQEPANYDWQSSHKDWQRELAPATPSLGHIKMALEAGAKALQDAMAVSAKDIATMAKQHRLALTAEALYLRDTATRPDSIPSNTDCIRVRHWEPAKVVSIPLPVKPGKPAEFIKVTMPERPIGDVIGTVDPSAWRAGEYQRIPVHAPEPLPAFKAPTRSLTATERQVAAWLAEPGRTVTRQKKSHRLQALMAKFWDKPDNAGIDPRNAELRQFAMPAPMMAGAL